MSLKAERELRQGMLRLVKPKDREFDALVGDGNGVIEVPGHPDQWYVRPIGSDLPLVVKRGAAPKVQGVRVRIGREFGENKRRKGRLAIYGVVVSNTGGTVGGLEPHAGTHLAGQSDPVYIDAVQIINGLAYASSGMTVKVNPGWTVISGQPVRWSLQTIDMTSHIPVSGALFALIRVDDTGTFDVQEGDAVDSYVDLSWPDVPAVEDGYKAWAIVRLYEGQASLSRLYANPDVISLHITPDTGGGGGGASALGDLTDVVITTPADNDALTYDDVSGDWINEPQHDASAIHDNVSGEIAALDEKGSPAAADLILIEDSEASNAKKKVQIGNLPGGDLALDDLTDVVVTDPADGDLLIYDEIGGEWINQYLPVVGGDLYWYVDGALASETGVGQSIVAPYAMIISQVILHVKETGSAGNTTVDININGASIFVTPPSVAYDDPDGIVVAVPDTTEITEDDVITVDIDDAATGAESLTIAIVVSNSAPRAEEIIPEPPAGRLTLTTGVAVTTSDVTAAETLYYVPYNGNRVFLHTGIKWTRKSFSELAISLAGKTANTNYDVFAYLDSGSPALELLAWSNATTRATELAYQDGMLVKSGDETRLYLGTIRITGTEGQCEDSLTKRFVWNYYNRVDRRLYYSNATSHTYTTSSWRAWNNSATARVEYICGVIEDAQSMSLDVQKSSSSTSITAYNGIGLDRTNEVDYAVNYVKGYEGRYGSAHNPLPGLGYHYLSVNEYSSGPTSTFAACYFSAAFRM